MRSRVTWQAIHTVRNLATLKLCDTDFTIGQTSWLMLSQVLGLGGARRDGCKRLHARIR